MKLTRAQVRVLTALASGPKVTSKTTHHGVVSGRCAVALESRGLVWIELSGNDTLARLTPAGEAELKTLT